MPQMLCMDTGEHLTKPITYLHLKLIAGGFAPLGSNPEVLQPGPATRTGTVGSAPHQRPAHKAVSQMLD